MTPLELVQQTSPPINEAGAAFYFHPDTLARGKELGLDGFRFYFLGRGGVLGDVDARVITSSFGYFHSSIVTKMWNSSRETMDPREAGRAYLACADALGTALLSDIEGLEAFNESAETVTDHADVAGMALYAGTVAEPLPDDPAARAYRNVVNHRELRGGVHLSAIVASGLTAAQAHAIRRPDDTAGFGWDPAPEVTSADRESLREVDVRTDAVLAQMFEVLSDSQRAGFADTIASISATLRTALA